MQEQLGAPSYEAAAEEFYRPRKEGEVDLVVAVRELLVSSGLGNQVSAHFDNHPDILEAGPINPIGQRGLINRFLTVQLLMEASSTMEARYYLINRGEVKSWLSLFEQFILPVMVQFNLPRQVG